MNAWTPLIPVALMLFAFGLRKLTPSSGFLHTALGATVIAFASGLLGALAQAIQAHGFSAATIVPAIASFAMSFIATANPSMGKAEDSALAKNLPSGSSTRVLLPVLFLTAIGMTVDGCATTRSVVADVAAQCGVKVASAIAQTEQVLMTDTTADAALADIAKIVGAAATDAEAVYCVIAEAVKSLKAKRATTGGEAPPETQLRPLVAGRLGLPDDPTAHGIALGEDLLTARSHELVLSALRTQ